MIIKTILKDWGLEVLILSFFIVVIIPYGAGITFDTVSFFQAGDHFWGEGRYVHFASDGGLEFAAHRFPLYPLILSLFKQIDPNLLALQIILFIAFIRVFRGFLKHLQSPKYFLLLLVTYPIFLDYYAIWTEGLYVIFMIALMTSLHNEQDYQKSIWILLLVIALCLTRMVGVVVAGSLFLAYIIDKRPLRGLLFFITGLAIIVFWTILGTIYLGKTARSFGYISFDSWDLIDLAAEIGKWITSQYAYPVIPVVIGFALMISPFFFAIKAWKTRLEVGVLFWFLIIHFYAYIIFIIVSKMFLDASIAFDVRTLFPLMINYIGILILMQTSQVLDEKSRSKIRYIFPKLIIVVVILNSFSIWNLRENGLGYNSKEWQSFEFVPHLQKLDSERVYTNDQAAIYLYAPDVKEIVLFPEKMNLYSREINLAYDAEMDVLQNDIQTYFESAYLVWIRNGVTGEVYPGYEELKADPFYKVIYDDWLCLILRKR